MCLIAKGMSLKGETQSICTHRKFHERLNGTYYVKIVCVGMCLGTNERWSGTSYVGSFPREELLSLILNGPH